VLGIAWESRTCVSGCKVTAKMTWSRTRLRQAIFFFFSAPSPKPRNAQHLHRLGVRRPVGDVNAAGLAIQLFQTPHHLFSDVSPVLHVHSLKGGVAGSDRGSISTHGKLTGFGLPHGCCVRDRDALRRGETLLCHTRNAGASTKNASRAFSRH